MSICSTIKISDLVERQIPDWVVNDHPKFVAFFKAYYEWVERKGGGTEFLRNLNSYNDIDKTIDEYVEYFKKEVISDLPENIAVDKRLLAKHIHDLVDAKGTGESFKLLFKILYDENVEIYYPRNNILKASNGVWSNGESIIRISTNNDFSLYIGATIQQGTNTAKIDKITPGLLGKYSYYDLSITDVNGVFSENELIDIISLDNVLYRELLYPIAKSYSITDGGLNNNNGDKLDFSNYSYDITQTYDGDVINVYVTSKYGIDEIEVYADGVLIDKSDYNIVDNTFVFNSGVLSIGELITFRYPSIGIYAYIKNTGLVDHEVTEIDIINGGIGYNNKISINPDVDIDLISGNLQLKSGYWLDNDGHVSSTMYLQGPYYQNFSYDIKSNRSIDEYATHVKNILHPAGFNMYGSINMFIKVYINNRTIDISSSSYINSVINYIASNAEYKCENGDKGSIIDHYKFSLDTEVYPVAYFQDMSVQDILDGYDEYSSFNIGSAIYINRGYIEWPDGTNIEWPDGVAVEW